jgi:hypothetical protein
MPSDTPTLADLCGQTGFANDGKSTKGNMKSKTDELRLWQRKGMDEWEYKFDKAISYSGNPTKYWLEHLRNERRALLAVAEAASPLQFMSKDSPQSSEQWKILRQSLASLDAIRNTGGDK